MTKKLDLVLNEVLKDITIPKENLDLMKEKLKEFEEKINLRLKKLKIDAELFVGGSFAKNTLIKKKNYDVDLFLRFDKKYSEKDLFKLSKSVLKKLKGVSIVHGSRDYFRIKVNDSFYLEVIPVIKIKNPEESKNITDLSFSHVKYLNSKIKSQKILDEIKLAKAFCAANEVYGAESYVQGFSGYSLELLVYYYKSFEKFLKELVRNRKDKLIIDIEKKYKNSKEIMFELNGSKLLSPVILIDPTYKERNALAALSNETYENFKKAGKVFLKNPKKEFFVEKKINLDELKEKSIKEGKEFIYLKFKTKKQEGDIAGTKLLKFYRHLLSELSRFYVVENSGFKYFDKQEGKCYFVLSKNEEIIYSGPFINDDKNVEIFKKHHVSTFIENGKIYAREKIDFTIKEFFKNWIKKNKSKIKEMYISKIEFI